MADLHIEGIQGSVGSFTSVKGKDGSSKEIWNSIRSFSFNDEVTDRKQLNNMKEGDKALTFVSDEEVNWIMEQSQIYERSFLSR